MKFCSGFLLLIASMIVAAEAAVSRYIIVFEKGIETPDKNVRKVEDKLKSLGGTITYEYNTVLKGFAVSIPEDIMENFQKEEMTSEGFNEFPFYVEKDQEAHISQDDDDKELH